MTELLTAAQMRAIEQAAIESGSVTGLELMERAGRGVVEAVFEEWPELAKAPHRAVVLCGPGNNGGDGFVVARLLKEWGWEVEVFLYGDPAKLPPDAKANYERWGEIGEVGSSYQFPNSVSTWPDLRVDGLFGTGLTRAFKAPKGVRFPIDDLTAEDLGRDWDNLVELSPKRVAIDIPSGVCADSGRVLGTSLPADLTVTFHAAKLGQFLGAGDAHCGKLLVRSIGLEGSDRPRAEAKRPPSNRRSAFGETGAVGRCPAVPPGERIRLIAPSFRDFGKGAGHKFSHGHALILSGGAGKTGAARLAARGALRIGAGLVTLGVPGSAQQEVAAQVTALMLARVDDADGLRGVLEDDRINALCLGPGMGVDRAAALLPCAVRAEHAPYVVLDADALTALSRDTALFDLLHDRCVLTPHRGEFARLFPDIAERLNATPTKGPAYSRVDATREAAARAGCVVLFKGPDTVIAGPDGGCSVNAAVYDRAAPWLATAGSGDVLAGFITGLLARGSAPMQAAETAAWLHVECARGLGPGLIAEDIPEELPNAFRALGVT